jgi:hypothetical protein
MTASTSESALDNEDENTPTASPNQVHEVGTKGNSNNDAPTPSFVRPDVYHDISRQVLRRKLSGQRHCVVQKAIAPEYLDSLFPTLLELFHPQEVHYNGGIAGIAKWKISCYLEVMAGGVPTADPNERLLAIFKPLLDACNDLFRHWYRQQHSCNNNNNATRTTATTTNCRRLMTFITRYSPNPGEEALLKVRNKY